MIESFRDEYKFLSNFQYLEKPLTYQGISYPTVEHFYQAMKSTNVEIHKKVANHPSKGLKAFSRTYELRDNWEEIKERVMWKGLKHKFLGDDNPTLKRKLQETGDQYIQEGSWWGDKYWGVCLKTGKGSNKLGKMLMKIREFNNEH